MNAREANSTEIKQLIKKTANGELYVRRPEVELQIEKVLSLTELQVLAILISNHQRGDNDYLLDETIVYLLREARLKNNSKFIEPLFTELNRRIWKLLNRFRSGNEADFEDLGQKVGMTILEKIFDFETDAGDFAQVQFGLFVVSEAKAVWKGNLAKLKREQQIFETEQKNEDSESRIENIASSGDLTPERRLIITEGLRTLTHHHQMVAAMLLDGFQIESKNPSEVTISRQLGVSSRTIRNWVKEMRAVLDGYQGGAK